jgi:uncharacterized protein YqeY
MLEAKILDDYKQAMKSRDTLKSSVLSFLRAEMLNQATAKNKDKLDDPEITAVIKKQIKQRQDSIEQFTKGGREEMAQKESREMEILKSYLPPEMPVEQIKALIEEALAATGASGMKDMGRLMKEVSAKVAGGADGRLISDLVRQRLSSPS